MHLLLTLLILAGMAVAVFLMSVKVVGWFGALFCRKTFGPAVRDAVGLLFPFSGRVSALGLWLGLGGYMLLVAAAFLYAHSAGYPLHLLDPTDEANSMRVWALIALLMYFPLVLMVKRLHDLDFRGWWLLLGLVPVLGWIALIGIFVLVLFVSGTNGPNRFGRDPYSNYEPN